MGLITEIGADASNYNKVMASLPGTANKASNDISQSLAKASKASEAMGGSLAKGSNQAGNALQNLSRVAQDIPFGFIGIQNNLNPLLESFQRLKAETGSTSGAFKALVGSLTGAGGLGLALAVVSSAFTIYTMWQQKAHKGTKDAADANKSYVDTLNSIEKAQLKGQQNGQSEVTRLNILYKATQDHTLSLTDRNRAYDELSDKYPKYFSDADKEKTLLGQNTKGYYALAASILASAQAKAYEAQIGENSNAAFENTSKRTKELQNYQSIQKKIAIAEKFSNTDFKGLAYDATKANQISNLYDDLAKSKKKIADIDGGNTILYNQNQQLMKMATSAEIAAGFKTESQLDDKNAKLKEQKTYLQQLETQLETLQNAEVQWLEAGNNADFFNLTGLERNINFLTDKISTLKSKISTGPESPTAKGMSSISIDTTLKATETDAGFDKAKKNLKELSDLKMKSRVDSKEYKQSLLEENSILKTLSNTIGQGLTGAFQAALSGTQSFADAFGEFIVGLISKLVAAIAAAAVLAALLSFTGLSSFTSVGSAFGGGASQTGSFANLVGQFTGVKLASGGVTTGPTHALIGEGKEQEAVLPLSHLDKMLENNQSGGGAGGMQLNTKISGTDLLVWLSRANKQANRIGGKS